MLQDLWQRVTVTASQKPAADCGGFANTEYSGRLQGGLPASASLARDCNRPTDSNSSCNTDSTPRGRRTCHPLLTFLSTFRCYFCFVRYHVESAVCVVLFYRVASRSRDVVQHGNVGTGLKSAPPYLSLRPLQSDPFSGFSISLPEHHVNSPPPHHDIVIALRVNTSPTLMKIRE